MGLFVSVSICTVNSEKSRRKLRMRGIKVRTLYKTASCVRGQIASSFFFQRCSPPEGIKLIRKTLIMIEHTVFCCPAQFDVHVHFPLVLEVGVARARTRRWDKYRHCATLQTG